MPKFVNYYEVKQVSMLFSDRIRSLREAKKITQRTMANALGIGVPMYCRIERGERSVRKEQIPIIAEALKADSGDLLKLWLADQMATLMKGEEEVFNEVFVIAKESKQMKSKKRTFTLIDMFAGCGGLSLGMEQAGFKSIFFNEIMPVFASTYLYNRAIPDGHYYIGDINKLNEEIGNYEHIWNNLDGGVDLVCGGPPCQGFSMANRQRIIDDPRNNLYKAYLQFLHNVRPKFFVMENVKGMAQRIPEIKEDFIKYLGEEYKVDYRLLRAQDFGVPQNRERLILIGNRMGIEPKEIFDSIERKKRKPFVLRDALVGLPHLEARKEKNKGELEELSSGLTERDFSYEENDFYKFINGNRSIKKLYNHKNRYNNPRDIEIYTRLPQGANSLHESIQDIMPYKKRNDIFKDKYFKLDETQICKTITSHMKFDCNMYIHPWESRGLSPREAARIQTFPDDYVIKGAQNQWYAQVGNAVPVKLAEAIGKSIMEFLK